MKNLFILILAMYVVNNTYAQVYNPMRSEGEILYSKCRCENVNKKTYLFDRWTYETDDYKDEYNERVYVGVSDKEIVVTDPYNRMTIDSFSYIGTAENMIDLNDGDQMYKRVGGNEEIFIYVFNENLRAFVLFSVYDSSEGYVFYIK